MSSIAKVSSNLDDNKICPTCHQPLGAGDSGVTPSPAKRSRRVDLSQRKKLKSYDDAPTGKFERPWDSYPNFPVYVNCIDAATGHRQWLPGVVDKVIDKGSMKEGTKAVYFIVVHNLMPGCLDSEIFAAELFTKNQERAKI